MDEIGILPYFRGTLIHDYWKPYYIHQYCQHGLCNAHHLRELQWVIDNHAQHTWAKSTQYLLIEINRTVNKTEKTALIILHLMRIECAFVKLYKRVNLKCHYHHSSQTNAKNEAERKNQKSIISWSESVILKMMFSALWLKPMGLLQIIEAKMTSERRKYNRKYLGALSHWIEAKYFVVFVVIY